MNENKFRRYIFEGSVLTIVVIYIALVGYITINLFLDASTSMKVWSVTVLFFLCVLFSLTLDKEYS